MIKVTDNFLEVDEFQFVENNFIQPEFPWFLSQVLDPNCDDLACAWEDNVQLCHLLYNAPQTSADGKESNGEYQFTVSPITPGQAYSFKYIQTKDFSDLWAWEFTFRYLC